MNDRRAPDSPTDAVADKPGRLPVYGRIVPVLCWFGLSPFLTPWLRRHADSCAAQHARQSDAVFLLFYAVVLLFLTTVSVLSVMMLFWRGAYEAGNFEAWTLSVFRKLLIVWAVFWAYGLGLALFGSRSSVPWLSGLSRWRGTAAVRIALALTWAALLAGGALAARGAMLAPESTAPARACFFYEDVSGRYPRGLFALGYYPAIAAAHRRWDGAVALRRLTRENLLKAVGEGEFLFIGSHGMNEGILLQSGFVTPDDVRAAGAHPQLRYVYLAGCDSGALAKQWEEAFAPARVVTQEGLTPLLEHIGWLWFRAPGEIERM